MRDVAPASSRQPRQSLKGVRVDPDGTLRSGANRIVLSGIQLPERRRLCATQEGARWPCGSMALAALRNLVGRESEVACEITEGVTSGICFVGNTDIAEWMLENGWAELGEMPSPKQKRAHETARNAFVGMWSRETPSARYR